MMALQRDMSPSMGTQSLPRIKQFNPYEETRNLDKNLGKVAISMNLSALENQSALDESPLKSKIDPNKISVWDTMKLHDTNKYMREQEMAKLEKKKR